MRRLSVWCRDSWPARWLQPLVRKQPIDNKWKSLERGASRSQRLRFESKGLLKGGWEQRVRHTSTRTVGRVLSTRIGAAAFGLLVLGCGSAAPSTSAIPSTSAVVTSPTATAPSPTPPQATLAVAGSRYGQIIVDGSGRTLYLFDIERDLMPRCYGACAVAWPPLIASDVSPSGTALEKALIATSARSDGSRQVTYNGHPLYYYVGDRSAGEIKCQAVVEFGGGWYVLDSKGNKISAP